MTSASRPPPAAGPYAKALARFARIAVAPAGQQRGLVVAVFQRQGLSALGEGMGLQPDDLINLVGREWIDRADIVAVVVEEAEVSTPVPSAT